VHAALAQLRPIQQELLDLAFWRGLTHQEIAAEVGMPLGTVKSHIRKAMQVLAEALCENGHGGTDT
jgi:RNA polymerase sigma-70 factor (ECF subfamily)